MPVTRSTHYFGDKPADAGTALEVVDQKVERPHLPLLRRPVLGRLPRRPILTEGRGDEGGRPARVGHGAGEQRLQLVEADLQCVVALEAGGPLQLPDQQCTPISRERTPRREGARPSSTEGRIRRAALQPIIHKMRRGFAGTQPPRVDAARCRGLIPAGGGVAAWRAAAEICARVCRLRAVRPPPAHPGRRAPSCSRGARGRRDRPAPVRGDRGPPRRPTTSGGGAACRGPRLHAPFDRGEIKDLTVSMGDAIDRMQPAATGGHRLGEPGFSS